MFISSFCSKKRWRLHQHRIISKLRGRLRQIERPRHAIARHASHQHFLRSGRAGHTAQRLARLFLRQHSRLAEIAQRHQACDRRLRVERHVVFKLG